MRRVAASRVFPYSGQFGQQGSNGIRSGAIGSRLAWGCRGDAGYRRAMSYRVDAIYRPYPNVEHLSEDEMSTGLTRFLHALGLNDRANG